MLKEHDKLNSKRKASKAIHYIADTIAQDWPPEEQEIISRSFERAIKSTARLMSSHKHVAATYSLQAGDQQYDDADYLTGLVSNLLESENLASPEALAYLEGNRRYRKMIEKAGGTYSTSQVAELLDISESGVRKRYDRKAIFGIELGNKIRFPVWQFTSGGNVLKHLSDVLGLINTESDAAKIRFFMTPRKSLSGSVVDALIQERDLDIIKREAASFGVHGAG